MAIPDVGVALGAPTPQMPAPAGNKSKAIVHEGRQSFASIVSDLSDDSRPSAERANGGAQRPAAPVQSEAPSERPVQNGRVASKPGANKSVKSAAQDESSTDLTTASADQQGRAASPSIETDAKGVAGRRSEARAEGESDAPVQGNADKAVDVPVAGPVAAVGFIANATVGDGPQSGDAERGVIGESSGIANQDKPANADGVVPRSFVSARGLKGEFSSIGQRDAGRVDPGGGTDNSVDVEKASDPMAGDGLEPAVNAETETAASAPSLLTGQRPRLSSGVTDLASVRQAAPTEAVLIARTSIRDALAQSVSADSSQADVAQASPSVEAAGNPGASTAASARGGDATSRAGTSESAKSEVASGFMSEFAGRRVVAQTSESVAKTSAEVGSVPSAAQASLSTLDVESSNLSTVDVDAALAPASQMGVATQDSKTSSNTAAAAAQIRAARVPGAGVGTPSVGAPGTHAQQTRDSTLDDAPASEDGVAATVTTLNPSPAITDRGLAPLNAQRAQARYARVSADAQPQSANSTLTTADAARSVDAITAAVPGAAVTDTPQVTTPQTLTTPVVLRNTAARALDARQVRALSGAGSVVSTSGAVPANAAVTPASENAIAAAQDARFADTETSEDDGAGQGAHVSRRGGSAADLASVDLALLNSPVRQFADAGAIGTSALSMRSAREANATAPAPIAQRLTGTSAIAIAAFQAVAAAALTTPDTVSSHASGASTRVMDLELPRQIVQLVRLRADNGDGQVHMRLNPDYLGDVSVDVRMNGASVVASVHASSAEVRDWLRTNEMQLRQTLADQGLHLQELVVADDEPSQHESSGQRQQPSDEQPQERRARRPRETATFEVLL